MKRIFLLAILAQICLVGCSEVDGSMESEQSSFEVEKPADFPVMPEPRDNPTTAEKVELGRRLFYDKQMSLDYSTSCASCHQPELAFADNRKQSAGFGGLLTARNSPSLANTGYLPHFFWEGGIPTLEKQALAPIIAPNEFNIRADTLEKRMSSDPRYKMLFQAAFGDETVTLERITKSISAFQRTLISGNSPYDKFRRGDRSAISLSAQRGEALFFGETGDCWHCHNGYNLTTNSFHNTGLDSLTTDIGRAAVTKNPNDEGKFKVPTLRNIALTAPYMHDGRFQTLEQVLQHYNSGGKAHPNKDALMRPLGLSNQEVSDLIEFLKSLSDTSFTQNPAHNNPWE